jgi:hypothetical protein
MDKNASFILAAFLKDHCGARLQPQFLILATTKTMAGTKILKGVDGEPNRLLQKELAELMRRSLLQLGDMKTLEQLITELSEKISRRTPLPEPPLH